MKFINGNEFSKLAHYSLDSHLNKWELNDDLLNNNAIIFCRLEYLNKLSSYIKKSSKNYILITHDSDKLLNNERFENIPNIVKKCFSINAIHNHKNLINIPLGLENEIVSHKPLSRIDYKWLRKNLSGLASREKRKDVVYCNWQNRTHATRKNIVNTLKSTDVNIIQDGGLTQYEYYERLASYKFVICPRGNGVDTHRLWETLYVGSIPVIIDHPTYKNFNLPIVRLKKWEDLTQELLSNFNEKQYSYHWLNMKNWETYIKDEFKKLK